MHEWHRLDNIHDSFGHLFVDGLLVILNVVDLVRIWCTQGIYKENCSSLLELCAKFKYTKPLLTAIDLNVELPQVVQNYEDPNVQNKLYQYYRKKQQPEEAKKHLDSARLLGSEEACREPTPELLPYRKIAFAFTKKSCNNRNLMHVIFESSYDWEGGVDIDDFFAALKGAGIDISLLDKDLMDVYFRCCCIMKNKTSVDEKLKEAERVFGITTHTSTSPTDRRGKRALFFLSLLAKRANNGGAKRLLTLTKDDNYLSRFIYNDIEKSDNRFVSWKYYESASFERDFPGHIKDFLKTRHKTCSSDYQNLEPKRFDRLFNLYFMNTELLEIK